MPKKAAVVGAGIGGLSAALELRARGFDADLYDKNSYVGGKAGCEQREGFTFDTGPSLLTMPFVFEKLLERSGLDPAEELPVIKLDIICRYFFSDGTVLDAFSDRRRLLEEFGLKTSDSGERVGRFLDHCRKIYDSASGMFLFDTLENVPRIFREDPLKGIKTILDLDIFRTFHASHERSFSDPKTIQLFDRYATYSGSDPYKLPATLNIVPHVEYGIGAYVPRKGIRAIPAALSAAAASSGVNIFTGAKVDRIIHDGVKVTGIEAGGRIKEYDIVVSNADVNTTYRDLLGGASSNMAARYARLEPSSSAIVFYWGIKGIFERLDVNNIFFSSDYRKEFAQIFDQGVCPEEPTVYVNITSKYCPSDAPEGCEAWFVLVNVPYDSGQDWAAEAASVKARALEVLRRRLGVDVGSRIISEKVMTPADIYEKTLSNRGSIYGISSNSRMAAYNRQPNRSGDLKGLYFAGGSAHPGGGMPLVALSGMIASDLVEKYET